MKVKRYKKASKRLNFYINNFAYRSPIQVLIDGTFCFQAIKNKLVIEDQLKNYLQIELRFCTTPCIIIETEQLGSKLQPIAQKLKSMALSKCGHEKSPLSGADCIKSIAMQNHYVVATQDRDLQSWIRKQAGVALFYLHNVVPYLDEPSESSKRFVNRKAKASTFEDERLLNIKKKEGLMPVKATGKGKIKKKSRGPNPLSCKKKKLQNASKLLLKKS